MTVTANTTRNDYTAGSAQSVYNYTFQLNEAADVDVYLDNVKQTLNTHYTVQNVGNPSGGTITFTLVDAQNNPIHPTQGAVISIVMAMDLDRDTNYQPSGAFLAADVNNDFDRLWLAANQQQTAINRSLRLVDDEVTTSTFELPLKDARKGKLLGFNAITGDPEASVAGNNSSWDLAYDNMIVSASFTGGDYTLTQQDGGTISTSLDGRYLQLTGGSVSGNIDFGSNQAIFGTNDELKIYNLLGASIIQEVGQGNLEIRASNLLLKDDGGGNYAHFTENGDAKLFFNKSQKLATTSAGISVTGTITASGYNDVNWNTAYGWGDHSQAGYLTATANSYNNTNWDTAYSWGDHSVAGYLTASSGSYNNTNWDTAYNNHITGVSYSGSTLTLTQQDGGTLTTTINGGIGQWTTSGNNIYYNTGNVGIGTASPSSQLTIRGTGGDTSGFKIENTNEIVKGYFGSSAADADFLLTYVGSNSAEIKLKHNGNVHLCESAGNVGIGTTNPAGNLHISSGTSGDATLILESDTDNNNESDNPKLQLRQDADNVHGEMYMEGNAGDSATDTTANALVLEAKDSNGNNDIQFVTGGNTATPTAGNVRMTITDNGMVGINTNPQKTFHVYNATADTVLRLESGDSAVNLELKDNVATSRVMGIPDGGLRLSADHDNQANDSVMKFSVDGTDKMLIDADGNVGIGTINPQESLHATGNIRLGDTAPAELYTNSNELRLGVDKNNDNDASNITFHTNNNEKVRIDKYGRVGIGTTDPKKTLEVRGELSVGPSGSTDINQLSTFRNWTSSGDADIYALMPSASTSSGTILESRPNAHFVIGLKDNDAKDVFSIVSTGGTYDTNGTETDRNYDKLIFCARGSSGNVGIGTNDPSNPFHVKATTNIPALIETTHSGGNSRLRFSTASGTDWSIGGNDNGNFTLYDAVNNNNCFIAEAGAGANTLAIDSNSRVGVGTDGPEAKLHVQATGGALQINNTNNDAYMKVSGSRAVFGYRSADGYAIVQGGSSKGIAFGVNNATFGSGEVMRIKTNGNVGIGTTNPQNQFHLKSAGANFATMRLDASGNTTPASFLIRAHDGEFDIRDFTASATRLTIDSSGNVGIGTDPSAKLDVDGNIAVSGTVDGRNLTTDGNKLDGIAAGAQQCSPANVQAAGALMDSELANELAVKQLNQNVNSSQVVTFGGVQINAGTPVLSMKTNSATVDDFRIAVDYSSGDITFQNHTNMGDPSGTITNFINYNQYGLALGNNGANTSSQNGGVSVSGVLYANNSFQAAGTITGNSTMVVSGNVQLATGTASTCEIATNGGGITMGYITQDNTINGNTTCNHDFTASGDVELGSSSNDTTVLGDFKHHGNIEAVNKTTLDVLNTQITLNSGYTGTSPSSCAIIAERGNYTNAVLEWNDNNHKWLLHSPTATTTSSVTPSAILTPANIGTELTNIRLGSGTATAPTYAFSNSTNTGMFLTSTPSLSFAVAGSEKVRINNSGQLLVNTTSGGSYSAKLRVGGVFETSSFVATQNTSRINNCGYYGSPGIKLYSYSSYSTSNQPMLDFRTSTGTICGSITVNTFSTSYNTSSDERMKENIQDAGDAGTKIDAIQVRQFDWKQGGKHEDFGVIAQELHSVAPEAVTQGYNEEDMWSVDYSKLVPTLIKEIQSLRNRVAQLENG